MLSISKFKFFSGSRGTHGPDLPSPFGRKFLICCLLIISQLIKKYKKEQGKNFCVHKFSLGGFCPGGFCPGGFCPGFISGGFCLGFFCPDTIGFA